MQDALFRSFLTSVRLENKSTETLRTYDKCLRKYRDFLVQRKKPLEVNKESMALFITWMTDKGLQPSSIRLYMVILKRFFEFIDQEFPKIKYPKTPRKRPIFIEKEDFLRMYDLIKDPEMRALVSIDYSTAMRINELVTRKVKDLEIKKDKAGNTIGSIFVTGKTGPESDARLPLDPTSIADLQAYLATQKLEPDDYIFHREKDTKTPASKSTLTIKLYSLSVEAGLEPMSWHKIRHSRATHLREQGVAIEEIQSLLRHASINTTLIYASTDTDKLRRVLDDKNVLTKRKS
jgi:site-specific recombinase XerD